MRGKNCWFFVQQSHRASSSHAAHDRALRSVGRNSLFFFPTVYVDRVTCSLILQCFLGQSGTKKESGRSRTLERTLYSQLRVSSRDLRGNYLRKMTQPLLASVYIRKHARALFGSSCGERVRRGGPDRIMHVSFIRRYIVVAHSPQTNRLIASDLQKIFAN